MATKPALNDVHTFWNTEACGTHFVKDARDEREFFEKFREFRYRTEWHIPLLVPFAEGQGRRVLEIGTGNGADAAMWALNGADYTGVDLTEAAIEATRRHFTALGLAGRFIRGSAEALEFPDGSFDIVYSHGVLHHTVNTSRAIDEVHRVLKPGGRAIVMLYHKHSFNYHVRIMAWMRLRVLLKILSRAGRWERDRTAARTAVLEGVRGNAGARVWELHYQNFLTEGWAYLRPDRFVHRCTDGPECPIAWAFSRAEAQDLFKHFGDVSFKVAHLPVKKYLPWFPLGIEKFFASRGGWYLFIYARR